jgi:polyribonucleotide nucleotidyltransferase
VVAGTPDGVVMVEAGANQLPEQDIIEAIEFGYEAILELIQAQKDLMEDLGIQIVIDEPPSVDQPLEQFIADKASDKIKQVLSQFEFDKSTRDEALDQIKETEIKEAIALLPEDDPLKVTTIEDPKAIGNLFKALTKKTDACSNYGRRSQS